MYGVSLIGAGIFRADPAMGFPAGPFRLPLVPLTEDQLKSVMQTIRKAGDLITFKAGVKVA